MHAQASQLGSLCYAWSFALGCLGYYHATWEPRLFVITVLAVMLGLGWLAIRVTGRAGPWAGAVILFVLAFVSGLLVAKLHTDQESNRPRLSGEARSYVVQALIEDIRPDFRGRLTLHVRVIMPTADIASGCRLRVKAARAYAPKVTVGAYRQITARLYGFYAPTFPGAWDSAREYWLQGFCGQGYVTAISDIGSTDKDTDPALVNIQSKHWRSDLMQSIYNWRIRIGEAIDTSMAAGHTAVAKAMAVGIRNQSDVEYTAWQRSGLAHLLAISGLHMGIVFMFSFLVFRRSLLLVPHIRHWPNIKEICAFLAVLIASYYLLLSGASISAKRAYAMALLAMIVIIVSRSSKVLRILAMVMVGMLIVEPSLVLLVGFQLSYIAVTGLALFMGQKPSSDNTTQETIPEFPLQSPLGVVALAIRASFIANLVTMPIVLYHFQSVTALGFVTNILAIPITALWLVPSLFVGVITVPFGWEGPSFFIAEQAIALLTIIVTFSNQFTDLYGVIPRPPGTLVVISLAALLAMAIPRRDVRIVAIVALAACLIVYSGQARPKAIISGTATAIMLEDADGRSSNTYRLASFEQEQWLSYLGTPFASRRLWRDFAEDRVYDLACQDGACVYRYDKLKLALVFSPSAVCPDADAVFFFTHQNDTGPCRDTSQIVTLADREHDGTMFVYPTSAGWKIVSTQQGRRQRPWFNPGHR